MQTNKQNLAQDFKIIAGPCSIESYEQFLSTALHVQSEGASLLRGGIWKMRTSPKSFQGLGEQGFEIAQAVCKETGLGLVTEITDPRHLESMEPWTAVFQVGARNMYNYALLKELGRTRKPVLLKRAFSAYVDEWLKSAEYILQGGNDQVWLCERGIRSFEPSSRNTLDLNTVAYLKKTTDFPVFVDPSHAVGRRDLVPPLAWASTAAGADGLLIEVHPDPEKALSDGPQSLNFQQFSEMMDPLRKILDLRNPTGAIKPVATKPQPSILPEINH